MVVQRRPAEIAAQVPTAVYAIDLERLSELLDIPEADLVTGFQAHPTLSEMHGVIVDAGQGVPFETVANSAAGTTTAPPQPPAAAEDTEVSHFSAITRRASSFLYATPKLPTSPSAAAAKKEKVRRCKQVLLTAAARPSSLDASGLPKCLITLGSQPIITHILTQLYAAGIERVVIPVAASGRRIMDVVKRSPFFAKMVIEFLDLGERYVEGHARSILAARSLFKRGPFLIHTADHIFDKSIITKFMNYQLNENVACVLVETDMRELVGQLPETTVKVQLGREKIRRIGREVLQYDGIDAGLFLSSTAIFDALDELTTKKSYFSLADALSYFTKYNKLTYISTEGETWFSIETEEQLAYTKDAQGTKVLSPWTVFLATVSATDEQLSPPPSSTIALGSSVPKNIVIGISASDTDASLRVAGVPDPKALFDGFVVGVTNGDRRDDEEASHAIDVLDDALLPLLALTQRTSFPSIRSTTSLLPRGTSFIESTSAIEDSMVISFPMDDELSKTIDDLSASHHAYLIEMNPDPVTPVTASSQFMLAVPAATVATALTPKLPRKKQSLLASPTQSTLRRRRELLPSDIKQISLETRGFDDQLEVKVVVQREVPFIGFVLLLTSLLTISSVGVALDMEDDVSPLLKLFWRNSGTCLVTFPLALLALRRSRETDEVLVVTRDLALTMLLAGMSYSFYLGSYVVSLSLTSVGHSTLFNNSHSLLIVLVKVIMGQPVQIYEALGTAVGVLGGAITAMDVSKAATASSIVTPTVAGDLIALAGAFGGATYFIKAKKLRPKMPLPVFLCCLTGISATCLLLTMLLKGDHLSFSMNREHGIFGWLTPSADRLAIAFYLVFVCDLVGTMGYISVMKYFDPIVISVVCLLEPIIANVMGILAGVDVIPGFETLIGATLVIGGTVLVILTQSTKTEQHDATDALKSTAMDGTPKPLYSARLKRKTIGYGTAP